MFSTIASISKAELNYIQMSCRRDIRSDGRKSLAIRPYTLEVGVIPTASGSARIRVESSNILAVVKMEVVKIRPDTQLIQTSVDLKPLLGLERQVMLSLTDELNSQIHSALTNSSFYQNNLLTIVENELAWCLSVDITVFSQAGNIFDLSLIAIRAAMVTTTIPAIKVIKKGAESSKVVDYSIDLVPGTSVPLGGWNIYLPLSLSLGIIDNSIIIDPTELEETCIGSRFLVVFDHHGTLISHSKIGLSGVNPQLFSQSTQIAYTIGKTYYEYFVTALSRAVDTNPKIARIMSQLQEKMGDDAPIPPTSSHALNQ